MGYVRAPQLPQDYIWFNSQPLSLSALRGRMVLLDFWTYCCINCLHVLPDLAYLEQKYPDTLTVIGVHSAKFDQEKAADSVRQALRRYDVRHPVVLDSERRLWQQYAIRAWPTFVLIDPAGYIVEQLAGEGHRERLDRRIAELVQEHRQNGSLIPGRLDAAPAPLAESVLAFPGKLLAEPAGNRLFIADTGHHRILVTELSRSLTANGRPVTEAKIQQIFGEGSAGLRDGDAATAQFSAPQGIAFSADSAEQLYVADRGNHCLRKIDLRRQQVATIAGSGQQSRSIYPHSGLTPETALNSPWDLVQVQQTLLIAMAGSHQIWRLDLDQQQLSSWIGTGAEASVDGGVEIAAFAQPSGLATDGQQLFVADSESSTVRAVTLNSPPQAQSLCGSGSLLGFGDQDGQGETVRLQHCMGLAYRHPHQLWIADSYNHKIKCLDLQTGICQTIAGSGHPGWQDGSGLKACFNEPAGLSLSGNWLYVADTNNHAMRQIDLTSLQVTTVIVT